MGAGKRGSLETVGAGSGNGWEWVMIAVAGWIEVRPSGEDIWWQGPGVGRRTQLGTALVEAGSCCIAEWKCGQLRGKGTTRAISAQWVRRNQGK